MKKDMENDKYDLGGIVSGAAKEAIRMGEFGVKLMLNSFKDAQNIEPNVTATLCCNNTTRGLGYASSTILLGPTKRSAITGEIIP